MEKVELSRFQTQGILGTGADYEVRAALDQETGKQVVLKRPMPQMISRQLHSSTEARTERMLQFFQEVGESLVPTMARIDVDCNKAGHFAGSDTDVGLGPPKPPCFDDLRIVCRVVQSVICSGVFPWALAVATLDAGATITGHAMQGDDVPAIISRVTPSPLAELR